MPRLRRSAADAAAPLHPTGAASRLRELRLGRRSQIALSVYGTIIVMATIAAESPFETDPRELAGLVAATAGAIWVAHLYAEALAQSIRDGGWLSRDELGTLADRELAIVRAAVGPILMLLIGAFAPLSEVWAIRLAFCVGLVNLAIQGARFASTAHLSRLAQVAAVGFNLLLGLAIVALKAYIGH